jgi:hypothetical protein
VAAARRVACAAMRPDVRRLVIPVALGVLLAIVAVAALLR